MLLDAFPLVKYKVGKKEPFDMRCFLQLPSSEISPEIVLEAYERLKKIWGKELDQNSAHREYVVRVLSLLDVAYESLTKGTTFEPCDLHQIVVDPQFLDDSPALVWLRVIFDKRKKLTADAVFHFFEKLCIEMVLDFMYKQNREEQTAYDLAVEHNRELCIQLLNSATVRERVCDPLRRIVEKCLRGEKEISLSIGPIHPSRASFCKGCRYLSYLRSIWR